MPTKAPSAPSATPARPADDDGASAPAPSGRGGVTSAALAVLLITPVTLSVGVAAALALLQTGTTSRVGYAVTCGIVAALAIALPAALAMKSGTGAASRLRVFAGLQLLAAVLTVGVSPESTVAALRVHAAWPVRVVGGDGGRADKMVADAIDVVVEPALPEPAPGPKVEPARPLSPKEVFGKTADSIVVIDVRKSFAKDDPMAPIARALGMQYVEGHGSGFFVGENLVVTNAHVAGDVTSVRVRTRTHGDVLAARVLAVDARDDLALLEVSAKDVPALPLAQRSADVGDDAIAIGSPLGLDYTLTTGLVSGQRALDGTHFLQVQTTIAPGSSGGPLLDNRGRVIGVTTATRGAGLNFAVDVSYVRALLQAPRTPKELTPWVVEPLSLVSFDTTGQTLPTTRASLQEAMDYVARSVDGCVKTARDVEVTFDNGARDGRKRIKLAGAPDRALEACLEQTRLPWGFFTATGEDQHRAVNARYHHSAGREVVVHIAMRDADG